MSDYYCKIFLLIVPLAFTFNSNAQKKINTSDISIVETDTGLQYEILEPGSGPKVVEGDTVWIFEATAYCDGTLIYSNMDSNNPIRVVIGAGQATKGMDEGLRGMQAGELRRLLLTPDLARRESYPDNLSPDSSVVITVRLHSIA